MRLKDIFYKDQILDSKEELTIKPEIKDFVLKTLETFKKLDKEDNERAQNFIGQALDSYEMEGIKEDFINNFRLIHIWR